MKPDYSSLDLPPPPPGRPYVLVNMVMSVDGKAIIEGTEQGIGSKVDQRLMRELRVNADVVMNGAGTLRASGASPRLGDPALEELRVARGKPRLPFGAVISTSGDLPLERIFFTAPDFHTFVYLAPAAPAARRAAIAATGRTVVDLPADGAIPYMLGHLRDELGAAVLLVEGGPTLNAQLFALGCVDEYFTTIGPVVVGGRDTLTPVEGAVAFPLSAVPVLDLLSAFPNEDTGEVYLRYRVRRP